MTDDGSRPAGPVHRGARRGDLGSVTAELAVTLPGVVVLLVVVLLAGVLGGAQVAVQDAARVTARAMAIGEAPGGLGDVGVVVVHRDGEWLHVTVEREVGVLGVAIPVTGRASVLVEPGRGVP